MSADGGRGMTLTNTPGCHVRQLGLLVHFFSWFHVSIRADALFGNTWTMSDTIVKRAVLPWTARKVLLDLTNFAIFKV